MSKKNDRFWKPNRPSQPESNLPTDEETSDGALQRARYKLLIVPPGSKSSAARARAMADLAQVYWKRMQFDEAIAIWHQLLELVQKRGDRRQLSMIHAALATTYAQQGEYAPAIQHAQTALLHDSGNPIGMLMLGNAYDGAGDDDNAFRAWLRLIAAHPDYESAYSAIGSLHARRGEFAEAEASLLKALGMKPESDAALNALANMYVTMGRFEDALARFREAQRLWPKSPTAYNNIGDCFMKMARYAEAIGAYEKRIEMRPKDALSANLCLGAIVRLRDDAESRERGTKHFREALSIYKSGQARLYTRRIDHDARGALVLTALDENTAVRVWQSLLEDPEIVHVGAGAVREWRMLVGLLWNWPRPPQCLGEVAALLTQKYGS